LATNISDPFDFYIFYGIKPKVIQYQVGIYPILNGIPIDYSPILYEKNDHIEFKYSIDKIGDIHFDEYMVFLHEAYKFNVLNIENIYAGTWFNVI